MDTGILNGFGPAKAGPPDIAALALDGIAAGEYEIIADDLGWQVQAGLAGASQPSTPASRRSRPNPRNPAKLRHPRRHSSPGSIGARVYAGEVARPLGPRSLGSIFALANGHIGLRANLDGGSRMVRWGRT